MAALKRFPYHFLLLLLFFLSHGYSEHVGLIPFHGMLIFFLIGAVCGALMFFLFKKILGTPVKAGIATTLVFLFYLFYGSFKAALHTHNRILVPLVFVIIVAAIFLLKKFKGKLASANLFINALLIIYLFVDAAAIIKAPLPVATSTPPAYKVCQPCSRPDIYFIILDEYTGSNNLKDHFHYDNSAFETALKQRNFFVANRSSSNYSATPVSVASIFSMDYLPQFNRTLTSEDYTRAERVVDKSIALEFLNAHGYRFVNYSIFNLAGQQGKFTTEMLPLRMSLITSKTLWNSISDDLAWQLASKHNWLANFFQVNHKEGNQRLITLTENAVGKKEQQPRFIYTHLLMPHWPYSFDSTGKETGINFYTRNLPDEKKNEAYIQFLAYTNKRMLQLMDTILSGTNGQAIIILMSDHGYRGTTKQSCESLNNNFLSVYLPGKDYNLFYDSMSNVNVFRAVFNTQFHQLFTRLPDRCIF